MTLFPSAIHCISSHHSWLYTLLYKLYYHSNLLQGKRQPALLSVMMLCCTTGYGPCHWDPCQCLLCQAQAAKRPIHFGLLVVDKVILGMLAIGLYYDLKSDISTALAVEGITVVCIGSSPTQGEAIADKVITTVMIGVERNLTKTGWLGNAIVFSLSK